MPHLNVVFYFMLKGRHMRPKQVNCHSVHHGWTIFVFNNQHCILIRSINHFGGRWNVVALWPLLYTNCPTALPWLSAAGCVRAHPAQCDAQVKCGELISEVVFWTSSFFGRKTVWWKFWLWDKTKPFHCHIVYLPSANRQGCFGRLAPCLHFLWHEWFDLTKMLNFTISLASLRKHFVNYCTYMGRTVWTANEVLVDTFFFVYNIYRFYCLENISTKTKKGIAFPRRHSPYLSALDFCNSLVWNVSNLMNWIFFLVWTGFFCLL